MDSDAIKAAFSDSVLFLEAAGEHGTGYLIESESGLVLTAGHVVAHGQCDATSPMVPKVQGKLNSGQAVTLKLVKSLCAQAQPQDLALLQLSPSGGMGTVRPLDLTLRQPLSGAAVTTLGYPQGIPQQAIEKGYVERPVPLQVAHASAPGLSGSPAIDAHGQVIGTAMDQVSSASAHFVPSVVALQLLQGFRPGKQVLALDAAVRSQTCGDELSKALMPGTRNSLSSVSLIEWAEYIVAGGAEVYRQSAKYFRCPITQAYFHRELDDEVIKFVFLAGVSAEVSRASINVGQRELASGNVVAGRMRLQQGLDGLKASTTGYLKENPKSVQMVRCNAGAPLTFGPFSLSGGVDCPQQARGQDASDQYLSGPYQDQALASLKLAGAHGPKSEAQGLNQDAVRTAALSLWSSGNSPQRALSYTMLGDALRSLGDDSGAGAAYATAYDLGLKPSWVGVNWADAVRASTGHVTHVKDIGGAQKLDTRSLLDSVALVAKALRTQQPEQH